jgi:hypothetical protein
MLAISLSITKTSFSEQILLENGCFMSLKTFQRENFG